MIGVANTMMRMMMKVRKEENRFCHKSHRNLNKRRLKNKRISKIIK